MYRSFAMPTNEAPAAPTRLTTSAMMVGPTHAAAADDPDAPMALRQPLPGSGATST
jgi:hypothetical protein